MKINEEKESESEKEYDLGTSLQHDNVRRQLAQNQELHQNYVNFDPAPRSKPGLIKATEVRNPNTNTPIIN